MLIVIWGIVYCPVEVVDEAVASVNGLADHPRIIEQRWNVKHQVSVGMYYRFGYETNKRFQRQMVSCGTGIRGFNLDRTFGHPHQGVNVCDQVVLGYAA